MYIGQWLSGYPETLHFGDKTLEPKLSRFDLCWSHTLRKIGEISWDHRSKQRTNNINICELPTCFSVRRIGGIRPSAKMQVAYRHLVGISM